MDSDLAKFLIVAVIGMTVTISMVVAGVTRVIEARRRDRLRDDDVAAMEDRLRRMEEAIDAMATEVERVSEGQRFTSRLLADREANRT